MLNISTNEFNQIPFLIKVNKKNTFNTANIFTKKQNINPNPNNLLNQSNIDFSSNLSLRNNIDYIPFNKIKSLRTKNDINNEQFDIVKFQSSCNILKQKINQLRRFSKEIESHSYDKIRNNSNYSDIKNPKKDNPENESNRNSINYTSYINKQNNINHRNAFSNLNLNYTSKKYFQNQKLFHNSFNNINEINTSNKKQYSDENINNHINSFNTNNQINNLNNVGLNNITRKNMEENNLNKKFDYDINIYNNYSRFDENERSLINNPLIINDEKDKINQNNNNLNNYQNTLNNKYFNNNIINHINHNINDEDKINQNNNNNNNLNNYQNPLYNKLFNNNILSHRRFNSYGINNFTCNNSNQIMNNSIISNNSIKSFNNENSQKMKFIQKTHETNGKAVDYFDKFFLRNRGINFIENSCNYNIVNQNDFQIQETSTISYFSIENNKNNNKEINFNINKNFNHDNNIFVPINLNNFSLNNYNKKGEKGLQNDENNFIKEKNLDEIKKANIQNIFINNKYNKKNNINDILKDSIYKRNDMMINVNNESHNNIFNTDTQGKALWDQDKENRNNNILIVTEPNNIKINSNKNKNIKNEKDDSLSKSDEEEIFQKLLEKVKQGREIPIKKQKKRTQNSNKKVHFDKNITDYIIYDLNKPATKIVIYDNKGKTKKYNPIQLNDYIETLKYSNISQYKKLKSSIINCPKINYKKIIEDSYKNFYKTNKNVNRKLKISPDYKNTRNTINLKKQINTFCNNIIKTIDPIPVRGMKLYKNKNKEKNNVFNSTNISKDKKRYILKNSCDHYNNKKNNKNKEKKYIDLKRQKAKEKILNAIEDIKKYFKEIE